MEYKYETHLHTNVSSKCGKSTPEEQVRFYKELGFTGIFVTDHFWCRSMNTDMTLPWKEMVHAYTESYRRAKKEGDKLGLQVFFGFEITFCGEDFLIVGLDEKWLQRHEEIKDLDQKSVYELVHRSGGFMIQAHPFRERYYMSEVKLHPHHTDAFEVGNACNEYYQDLLAYDYAKKHHLPMTAGSDIHQAHRTRSHCIFGIVTKRKLRSARDYGRLLLSGEGYRMNVPDGWFEGIRNMNPFFDVTEFNKKNQPKKLSGIFYKGGETAPDPRLNR